MKKINLILFIFLLSSSEVSFSQSQVEITKKSVEIIQWINNFEDNNSPERIMQGTFQDKVSLEYNQGTLIIYSMIWMSTREPIMIVREKFNIKDIARIEAQEKTSGENVIVNIAIFVKEGSISLECKNVNEDQFYRCSFEDKWFDRVGFCSKNLRFKFPKETATSQIERVYKALSDLTVINGGNPKVGTLY